MANNCQPFDQIDSISFVSSIEVPCGFILKENTPTELTMFIDTHCVFCVNEQLKESLNIPGTTKTCEVCLNKTLLVGALHYDVVVNNFIRKIDSIGTTIPAALSKSQSICVHKIPVALNCDGCVDPCNFDVSNFNFTPEVEEMIVYTQNVPTGIPWVDGDGVNQPFFEALRSPSGDPTNNANGCKAIVITGVIKISNAN